MSDNLHEALHSYPRSSLDQLATKSPERKNTGNKTFSDKWKKCHVQFSFPSVLLVWKIRRKKIVKCGRVPPLCL